MSPKGTSNDAINKNSETGFHDNATSVLLKIPWLTSYPNKPKQLRGNLSWNEAYRYNQQHKPQ